MSDQLFKAQMEFNNLKMNRMPSVRTTAGRVYVGIKRLASLECRG